MVFHIKFLSVSKRRVTANMAGIIGGSNMSRYAESKIPEIDERIEQLESNHWRLDTQVKSLRRADDIIKELRIVELSWKDRCECGVETINRLLEDGFELYKQFQTESGVVVELGKWGPKN